MFQSFEDRSETAQSAGRVARLRALLAAESLSGFVVPRADEHQSEYVPPCAERLAWLTGFSGSAGVAVVLGERAALLVDGRYALQAPAQVDGGVFDIVNSGETSLERWLGTNLRAEDRLGYDPRLHTLSGVRALEAAVAKVGASLVATPDNPLDRIWSDRPAPPLAPVRLHPERHAGESAPAKLDRLREALAKADADALVLTEPDAVAWTFNIRGGDVQHTPLPLSYAIVRREGRPTLVIDGRKLSNEVRAMLADLADLAQPAALESELGRLSGCKVRLDPARASSFVAARLAEAGATLIEGLDIVVPLKAVKNAAEISGARAAHERDGAAVTRFLAWLDRQRDLDEIGAAEALERLRVGAGALDVSFPTISGAGPNGAIVHYRVTRATNRKLEPGSLFLLDSGAQYEDGTTDITRTVLIGEPMETQAPNAQMAAEMRRAFTLVLKGHIAIATARFPKGATGAQLDTLARDALWRAGLDYDHGTGHGIGSYLSVHEGPQGISKRAHVALEPGMILSNEPGYYREGAFGIRIENLVLVTPPAPIEGGDREMLGFETLTLAPIDRRLIDPALLTASERAWLDAYHARVRALIGPRLDAGDRAWFEGTTAPL